MGVRNENSTSYVHIDEPNVLNIHKAMEYNAAGEPVLRVSGSGTSAYESSGNISGSTDAFGRLRVSQPVTLFDSSHRFSDNALWAEDNTGGGSSAFVANEGLVNLSVGAAANDEVIRETKKVFSYQPGKSLLVMNTFVMNSAKAGLRQRVGYFGADNGIYIEQDGTTINLVKRSKVTGSVVDTQVAQSNWNVDKLDGTGVSGINLDLSKAQIFWVDLEWLGAGSVRCGFVINGQFVVCHIFHHANIDASTYITTASLPIRYEITNTAGTAGASTLKQICSTVLSEGGYTLTGGVKDIQTPLATPYNLILVDTYYPVISIRLKSSRLDAVAILSGLSIIGLSNNTNYQWKIIKGGTTTGGAWISGGADCSVDYNITGTSFTGGGYTLAQGWFQGSNQGSTPANILKDALFKLQLERDTFTSTPYEMTLVVGCDNATSGVYAGLNWEEITR